MAEKQDNKIAQRFDNSTSKRQKGKLVSEHQTKPAELIISPAEYLAAIALPTIVEFMGALDDRRHAYLACMTAAHLVDQITRAEKLTRPQVRAAIAARGGFAGEALEIVEGIANGTKHAGTGRGEPFPFAPGHERHRSAFEFDKAGAGLDESDWNIPGLTVTHRKVTYFIDECARSVVWAFVAAYPNRFASVDITATKPGYDRWGVPV